MVVPYIIQTFHVFPIRKDCVYGTGTMYIVLVTICTYMYLIKLLKYYVLTLKVLSKGGKYSKTQRVDFYLKYQDFYQRDMFYFSEINKISNFFVTKIK